MADNIFTSVLRGALTRSKVEVATEIKRGIQGAIGQATDGRVGTPQGNDGVGEGIGGVQRRPTAAEAAQQVRGGVAGDVNNMTRNVLNRFEQGRTQTPNLAETVGSIPGRILGAILPSQGTVDRLTGGARAVQETIADPASLVRGRIERQAPAPVEDRSTYSAAAIEEARRAGRDTRNMRQTPPDPAAVTATAPAAAPPAAAPPERSWWQRLTGAASSATAAVATAVTVATTPAAAAPEAPARPSGQGFVLVTPAEHAADLAAQAAAIQVTTPAATIEPLKPVDLAAPAVTTSVAPSTQFSAAASPTAAPVKPSITAGLDAAITQAQENKEDAGKYERARAQILANYGPSNG